MTFKIPQLTVSQINANQSLLLQVEKIPTPNGETDMMTRKFLVMVTQNSLRELILFNAQKLNSLDNLRFVLPTSYLQVNYDQTIRITKGTFSKPLNFTSNTNHSFLANMLIETVQSNFVFRPSTFIVQLGQFFVKPRISVSKLSLSPPSKPG